MNSEKNRKQIDIVIIGAGMAGLLSAIRLKRAGYEKLAVIEKASDFGGTWRDNTYPGLSCDTPAHSYTYSFSPNANWSSYLAPGPEILAYLKQNARENQIANQVSFNEEVTSCVFDQHKWRLSTSKDRSLRADVVICATGVLHHPRLPNIKGIQDFGGAIFHSSRWDHSVALEGKRIAVIGNGSTGVQLVSKLVHTAGQLSHFQRTPQWIMPVENMLFTEEQKEAFRTDAELLDQAQNNPELDMLIDAFSQAIVDPNGPEMQGLEAMVLANLEDSVTDPELKELLRPNYKAACKRLIYSPDYYQAIQSPNAQLVCQSIEKIEKTGIRTKDGVLHEFDVIALATGFQAHKFMRPMTIVGQNGVDLDSLWKRGPTAYLSVAMPNFPNFFMLNGPNGPVGNFSLTEIAESQQVYIEQILSRMGAGEFTHIVVDQEAFDDYNRRHKQAAKTTVFGTGCQSWYLGEDGVPATWPWTRAHFKEVMREPNWADYRTWNV